MCCCCSQLVVRFFWRLDGWFFGWFNDDWPFSFITRRSRFYHHIYNLVLLLWLLLLIRTFHHGNYAQCTAAEENRQWTLNIELMRHVWWPMSDWELRTTTDGRRKQTCRYYAVDSSMKLRRLCCMCMDSENGNTVPDSEIFIRSQDVSDTDANLYVVSTAISSSRRL